MTPHRTTALLFLAPFHWIGFFASDQVIASGVVALLFEVVALALVGRALYLVARVLKHGRGSARFARFPFRRGEAVELLVPAPRALATDGRVCTALRIEAWVPADAPATAPGALPPRYWGVELAAARPGVDCGATFPVPVY